MHKLLTKEEIQAYLDEHKDVSPFQDTEEFLAGACWLLETNAPYIEYMLETIQNKQTLVNRYIEKVNDYEEMFMGAEPSKSRKPRKKSAPTEEEKEVQMEVLADMMFGDCQDDYDDDDEYYG